MIQHWTFRVTAVAAAIAAGLAAAPRITRAAAEESEENSAAAGPLTERQKALHVLNRLGFGPRPGDVERVERMGVAKPTSRRSFIPSRSTTRRWRRSSRRSTTLTLPPHKLVTPYYEEIRGFIAMQAATGDTSDMKLRYGVDVPKPGDEKDKPEATEAEKAPPAKTGETMGMGDGMQMLARNVSLRALGRAPDRQGDAGGRLGAAVAGGAGRLLVEPLQRRREEGRLPRAARSSTTAR